MPKSYTELYFPILLQAVIAMGLAAGLLTVSYLLGKKVRNRVKDMPYESGIVPTGDARHRFSVKFYLVGMLFILFDIEAIFLYPWAVVFKQLKMFGFLEMLVFVVLILAGFFFVWKKGVLDWAHNDAAPARPVGVRIDLTPVDLPRGDAERAELVSK
jgi:NADH-quinone oxidoreductase subunit A